MALIIWARPWRLSKVLKPLTKALVSNLIYGLLTFPWNSFVCYPHVYHSIMYTLISCLLFLDTYLSLNSFPTLITSCFQHSFISIMNEFFYFYEILHQSVYKQIDLNLNSIILSSPVISNQAFRYSNRNIVCIIHPQIIRTVYLILTLSFLFCNTVRHNSQRS